MTKVIILCLCFGFSKSSWVNRKQLLKTEQSAVQGGLATLQKSVDHFVDIDRSRLVYSRPPRMDSRPSVHPYISVHNFKNLMVRRSNPSMMWTVQGQNPSTRPPQNDNLGPASESVHEIDGLSPNFGPMDRLTVRKRSSSSEEAWFVEHFLTLLWCSHDT